MMINEKIASSPLSNVRFGVEIEVLSPWGNYRKTGVRLRKELKGQVSSIGTWEAVEDRSVNAFGSGYYNVEKMLKKYLKTSKVTALFLLTEESIKIFISHITKKDKNTINQIFIKLIKKVNKNDWAEEIIDKFYYDGYNTVDNIEVAIEKLKQQIANDIRMYCAEFRIARLRRNASDYKLLEIKSEVLKAIEKFFNDYYSYAPCEFRTPKGGLEYNAKNVNDVKKVMKFMNDNKFKVNKTTGLHIHLSASNIRQRNKSFFDVLNVVVYAIKNEHKMYKLFPSRKNNPYTESVQQMSNKIIHFFNKRIQQRDFKEAAWTTYFTQKLSMMHRNQGVNLESLAEHNTIEFRYGAGTFDTVLFEKFLNTCIETINQSTKTKVFKYKDLLIKRENPDAPTKIFYKNQLVTTLK